jgi:protein-disulfide isomerase
LLLSARPGEPSSENVTGYVLAMSTVGLGVILYLAYGTFFVLKTVCVLCLATWVAVIGLFVVSASATSYPMSTLPSRAWRDLRAAMSNPLAVIALLLLGAGAVSALAYFPREQRFGSPQAASATTGGGHAVAAADPAPAAQAASAQAAPGSATSASLTPQEMAQLEAWVAQQPKAIVPVDAGGAAVTVVKFHDFQCPPCKQAYMEYKPILQKYAAQAPGKVKFVTKHFPIDPECNAGTPTGTHLAACEAAAAVLMAKGSAAELLEGWLFANQASLSPMGVKVAARDVAGIQDFDAQYPKVLEQVKADVALGRLLNVSATPTFFVNGIQVKGGMPPKYFDALIALELKKSAK